MAKFNNTMDVFKLLEKSNCKKCNKPTCLAFAAAVFQGQASLKDCPYIDESILKKYGTEKLKYESNFQQDYQKMLAELQSKISEINLEAKAEPLGGKFAKNKLTLKVMGKDFSINTQGKPSTDIHVNEWIMPPILSYIISGRAVPLSGAWVPFRELDTAADWARFFDHQCVAELKKVADNYTNFFRDIIELFNGQEVEDHYDADISLVIKPLPLFPVLICYNEPEDGLESDLNLFFDKTADKNLPVEHIYNLSTGMAKMFAKLARTHG